MNRRRFLQSSISAVAAGAPAVRAATTSPENEPAMRVLLWCWDARMTWDDQPEAISLKMASAEKLFPYRKRPEAYLIGFKRLVDYCAKIGVRGFIVWGFLRECHGGVNAAVELCKYAADRGVSVIPGVGLCSYGGFYFEGNHPFHLGSYLRKHPERVSKAVEQHGGRLVTPVLDPSLPENHKWWRDGLEWMLETFAIGGVNFEMGDFIVNPSPAAKRARAALGLDCDENIQDIVVATADLIRYGRTLAPYGLFINSTYRGYDRIAGFPHMDYVNAVPKQTVWQYTLRNMVRAKDFATRYRGAPDHRRYGYLHWFNASTKTEKIDYVSEIARVFPGLHSLGFSFAGSYGELSAIGNPLADRNYRAQTAWATDPNLAPQDF